MPDLSSPVVRTPLPGRRRNLSDRLHGAAQIIVGSGALAMLLQAARMNRHWAQRHLLPDILVPSDWLMMLVQVERATLAALALLLLLLVIPRPGRTRAQCGKAAVRALAIGAAVLLALPASELVRQLVSGRMGQAWNPHDEPLRRSDPTAGWVNIPSRQVADPEFPWRPIYVIDAHGYRIAAASAPLDTATPSTLFVGESIMFGKGLNWRDTVAGRYQAMSHIQSANISVNAYSASQSLLRLKSELPRFRHPVAIVILFAPTLLMRELDRNRPWIDRAGQWHAARRSWYLTRLTRVLLPYRSPSAIDEAVATDRRILMADVATAHARGARPIVLVPVFQPEPPRERALRKAIFDGSGIPHLVVPIDQRWRLFPDSHPDARAHAAMARALWTRLGETPDAARPP